MPAKRFSVEQIVVCWGQLLCTVSSRNRLDQRGAPGASAVGTMPRRQGVTKEARLPPASATKACVEEAGPPAA